MSFGSPFSRRFFASQTVFACVGGGGGGDGGDAVFARAVVFRRRLARRRAHFGLLVFIAWHILVLDSKTRGLNSEALTAIQFFIVAALCLVASLAAGEEIEIERWGGAAIFALVLTVLGATMFSFWAQTRFQPRLPPVTAALIFVMEPVFAALFAALFYGESVSATAGIGAALILAAMAVAAREAAAAAARKRQPRPLA